MEDRNTEDYGKLLRELLEQKQYTKLRQEVADMNVADVAAVMDEMEDEESLRIFRILPKGIAADVFANLEIEVQQYIIQSLSDKEASSIIDNLMADDATDLLEEMPANIVKKILKNAKPQSRDEKRYQSSAQISRGLGGKHHDGRVCRPEGEYDSQRRGRPHPQDRT